MCSYKMTPLLFSFQLYTACCYSLSVNSPQKTQPTKTRTIHLWSILCLGATWLPRTFWLGVLSHTPKATAVLSLWPKTPNRNSDNSETEGEEGFDNANFAEQHADWPLGNTPQTVSVQSSVGDRIKSNSCNKAQADKEEAKETQRKKKEVCEIVNDINKAAGDVTLLIRHLQPDVQTQTVLSIQGSCYGGGFWKTCGRKIRVGSFHGYLEHWSGY